MTTTPTTDWLRHRAIGRRQKMVRVSMDSMRRLQLETTLRGHTGCVNCLQWNQSGSLLASGSDDRDVILWDPYYSTKKAVVKTSHEGNIFSVKYIPETSDTLIATCAADNSVKLINVCTNELLMDCKRCHTERVKRLAVHPNAPNLIWSAGEDGQIMQYDVREEHRCGLKPKNLLIDLKTTGLPLSAKCLDVNPMREEMLAVGSNDIHVRLFDRRYISSNDLWNSCTAYLTPGHLLRSNNRKLANPVKSHGTTYLSFSPDGSELLSNLHAEQIYLFNTYKPWERYKSFESTLKPLMEDRKSPSIECSNLAARNKSSYSLFQDLNKCKATELPDKYCEFYQAIAKKLRSKVQPIPTKDLVTKDELDRINIILSDIKSCIKLYHLRAGALIQRGWRGDYYQAVRDCCSAFALNPADQICLENLALASHHIGDKETTLKLLESLKDKEISDAITALVQRERDDWPPLWIEWVDNSPQQDDNQPSTDSDDVDMIDDEEVDDLVLTISSAPAQYINQFMNDSDSADSRRGLFAQNCKLDEQFDREWQRSSNAFDYSKRFCGHCNLNTDIKEANFFGQDGEFIVAGSDDGAFYIWDKETTNIVKAVYGDLQILNCLQPHPNICMLATSGVEDSIKLWSPGGKTCKDVTSLEVRCAQNQKFILSDPLEALVMMFYSTRDT